MTPKEAIQVMEQARMVISLNGKESDILRQAVIVLNEYISATENENIKDKIQH